MRWDPERSEKAPFVKGIRPVTHFFDVASDAGTESLSMDYENCVSNSRYKARAAYWMSEGRICNQIFLHNVYCASE